jgi:hypothetical protein
VLKTGIRNKLSLQDVFERAAVDRSLQSILHSHLHSYFKSQMVVFNFSDDNQKHSNKTKEVRATRGNLKKEGGGGGGR